MELTEKSFTERIKKIVELADKGDEDWEDLCNNLKEKGVEYCVVLPLFEIVLGFDPLSDISMGMLAKRRSNQIFDFTIQSEGKQALLVECKSFTQDSLDKHEDQIVNYMKENPEFPWGILTNGLVWRFYLSKRYIERKHNEGDKIALPKMDIIKIFSLELKDKLFLDVMKSMSKGELSSFWNNATKLAHAIIISNKGKNPKVHDVNEINEFVTDKIIANVEVKTGDYWSLIDQGTMQAGDEVTCKNDFIEMKFILDAVGRLILNPENINVINYKMFLKKCHLADNPSKILEELMGSTNTFAKHKSILYLLTGHKSLHQATLDKFPFNPPPLE